MENSTPDYQIYGVEEPTKFACVCNVYDVTVAPNPQIRATKHLSEL